MSLHDGVVSIASLAIKQSEMYHSNNIRENLKAWGKLCIAFTFSRQLTWHRDSTCSYHCIWPRFQRKHNIHSIRKKASDTNRLLEKLKCHYFTSETLVSFPVSSMLFPRSTISHNDSVRNIRLPELVCSMGPWHQADHIYTCIWESQTSHLCWHGSCRPRK